MMHDAGFRTDKARSADVALAMLNRTADIGILFTDVVMPGSKNGLKLAANISATKPDIRIIVASGNPGVRVADPPPGGVRSPIGQVKSSGPCVR